MDLKFFATTAKGIEEVLASELGSIGIKHTVVEKGGVRFIGSLETCYRANLWLRTANRILMTLTEFNADSPDLLYEGVRTLPWARYLTPDLTLAVTCNLRDSRMTHSGFVALKAKDAIVDAVREHYGRRPNVDTRDPAVSVNVHVVRNRCTLSLDTSGASLDKRGYRLDKKEAPLRETLAAALIELSGWNGTTPLVDPMCGSGTIPIEAALKATRRPPGLTRPGFGFQRWLDYDPQVWEKLVLEARGQCLKTAPVSIVGSDVSVGALQNARKNADRAGLSGFVTFLKGDIGGCAPPPPPGVLLFNPPYGARLGDEESLIPLYKKIGNVMKQRYSGYSAYILTGNPRLVTHIGLRASRRIVLFNGPIECRLIRYELY